ncbi:nucleoside hydrolase [Granulibacter bethesdensis]|uniref:Inosine-uridine preferring nucleoside hydrolase n=1 Tax=Granulibacter bethesdensis (strain ATCC BAA-1260 / CGDNIH1) TaxID=391165 RepID=Q0BSG4_GRABC|nr:nucleoside hydrolase [Granulibacter bethesdensis]ABI62238.1 Inosine-uridine preferring nucleoside hydrolase [Granulibacter bethesdensis CGDNIH1]AHJ68855.1 Inosine-uridine preferring nucleoside hydrolase [Granulibacter bethesdensis]APH52064.1 Inosine-uridine preferring nucleoside hydrolase [Granulibacter bethesdensis]APH64755.1 Inosine-uridine preferring nucleoside hydrolase [Granulibacter bethesdensis]
MSDQNFHPVPVILDTDPGTDDALAILLALASPELEIKGLTVVGGNVGLEHTLRNALALTALAGATTPVHAGANQPLLGRHYTGAPEIHGADGLAGVDIPAPSGLPSTQLAADVIRAILRDNEKPVTLVGIGPATNLALALATEPTLCTNIDQIVLMSGSAGRGNVTPYAEFNAWSDPEALSILIGSGVSVVLVTLDLTRQARITPERIARLRKYGTGRALNTACDILSRVPLTEQGGEPLHDPCAIAWLVAPHLFSTRLVDVSVMLGAGERRGQTMLSHAGQASSGRITMLDTVDAEGFFTLLGNRLARLP